MGPDLEYLGPLDGGYEHFRDSTGQDYTLSGEDASVAMSGIIGGQSQAPAAPPPEPNVPLTGVIGVPSEAPSSAGQGMPRLQGLPQEYGGAPPTQPNLNLQRVTPRERQARPQPTMRPDGTMDLGDGTVLQQVRGSQGGWQHASRRGGGMAPELMGDLVDRENQLYERRKTDIMERADFEREQRLAETEKARAERVAAQEQRSQAESRLKAIDIDRESKWNEFTRRQEQIGNMKLDENEGQTTGSLILSALAAGAGAYASAMTGAPNFALDILNKRKQMILERQSFNINKAKGDLASERDEYDRYISPTLEGRRLEQQAAIEKEQLAKTQEMMADKSLGSLNSELSELYGQLESQHNETLSKLYSQYQVESADRYVPGSAGGLRRVVDPELQIQKNVRDLKQGTGGTQIATPEGQVIGEVADPARAAKLNERIASFSQAERYGTQMLEIIQKHKAESFAGIRSEEDKARYNTLATMYKNALWSAVRSDAPSESESTAFADAIGGLDLANLRTGNQSTRLQQTLEDGRAGLADIIQQNGGDPSFLRKRGKNPNNEGYVP